MKKRLYTLLSITATRIIGLTACKKAIENRAMVVGSFYSPEFTDINFVSYCPAYSKVEAPWSSLLINTYDVAKNSGATISSCIENYATAISNA